MQTTILGRRAQTAIAVLLLAALATIAGAFPVSSASAEQITTCQAIGCSGIYFDCRTYCWGGSHPGCVDCKDNLIPGQ